MEHHTHGLQRAFTSVVQRWIMQYLDSLGRKNAVEPAIVHSRRSALPSTVDLDYHIGGGDNMVLLEKCASSCYTLLGVLTFGGLGGSMKL